MDTKPPGVRMAASQVMFFERYYKSYGQAVYANIRKLVADPQLAQDLLQDVFIALWENMEGLDPDRIPNWLFVVSYNKSVTCLKKKLRGGAVILLDPSLPVDVMEEEPADEELHAFRLSILEEAIDKLPARKRQVFRLCRIEGRSVDEVAELLGISIFSVKDYLKQSTRFIRNYVKLYYPHTEAAGFALLAFFLSC